MVVFTKYCRKVCPFLNSECIFYKFVLIIIWTHCQLNRIQKIYIKKNIVWHPNWSELVEARAVWAFDTASAGSDAPKLSEMKTSWAEECTAQVQAHNLHLFLIGSILIIVPLSRQSNHLLCSRSPFGTHPSASAVCPFPPLANVQTQQAARFYW